MFTGIINNAGKISEKTDSRLTITTDKKLIGKLNEGASIAVDGICLTVVSFTKDKFSIDFIPETAKKTSIRYFKKGDAVNLEMPATSSTFLAGHIVQGHIDAVGKIINIKKNGNSRIFTFSLPENIEKYIVKKGSVAVNGISLTVIDVTKKHFTVGIIPHTWKKTMLSTAKIGDYVNIEADVLAKYVEKLLRKKV